MSDDIHLLSRRGALKGLGAFAGTSAVGAGTILHASEPAAATGHAMSIDNITIETTDGEISELGLSALWFEVTYENIPHELMARFRFIIVGGESATIEDKPLLDLSGEGTETFGYGEVYSDEYESSLDGRITNEPGGTFNAPISITDEAWLQNFSVPDGEDENSVALNFNVYIFSKASADADPSSMDSWDHLDTTTSYFEVDVHRLNSSGDVPDGEGDAYGED